MHINTHIKQPIGFLTYMKTNKVFQQLQPYLEDNSRSRAALALQSEFAECLDPTFKELKIPKLIRHSSRVMLWISNLSYIALRTVSKATVHNNWGAALQGLIQEGISGVSLPTLTAWTMNGLQNKFYKAMNIHPLIKNLIRPIISLKACSSVVKASDPIGRRLATKICDYQKKSI